MSAFGIHRNANDSELETYVSTDIETDGPIPGVNSMLSLGSVAFDAEGKEIAAFEINLEALPGAAADPETMAWWKTQPEAWQAARREPAEPAAAMKRYLAWVEALPGKPVFVAYPLLFDMMFVYWYVIRFCGRSPFGFSGIDIKTLAYAAMGAESYRDASKKHMPKHWLPRTEALSHVAVEDAREQGRLFFNIRAALEEMAARGAEQERKR
jgi:DNA polymerase III alpha subunit (gram-positive type)